MPTTRELEYLFSEPCLQEDGIVVDRSMRQRVKTIRSGPLLEVESFPVCPIRSAARKARGEATPEEQREVNRRNAVKKFDRKAHANFTPDDIALTLTLAQAVSGEQAQRYMSNYIASIRRYRRRRGLPELKYMYVIESNDDEEDDKIPRYRAGPDGRMRPVDAQRKPREKTPRRLHFHVILSGMDRDAAEKFWKHGYANARKLQFDENGISGLTHYMLKDPRGKKRWSCSKNLADPIVTVADKKLSRRRIEKIASDADAEGKAIFERLYPGYAAAVVEVKRSDRVPGVYIYARMFRRADYPDIRTPKTRAHARTGTELQDKGEEHDGKGNHTVSTIRAAGRGGGKTN